MPEQTQFRAALHGYNREDVVNFLDRMSREHEEELRRLRDQNEQLRAQLEEARQSLETAGENPETEKALADAQALTADLRGRCEDLEAQVRSLEEQLSEARAEQKAETVPMKVSQELSDPIPPVAELLPVQTAPSKDYTELELAAYRRAELAERLARERAGDVYRQVQSVFEQSNEKLETGRADLEQLTGALNDNVNDLLRLLTHIHSAYDQAALSFGEIGARNREILEEEI